jgi:hypothetical protein
MGLKIRPSFHFALFISHCLAPSGYGLVSARGYHHEGYDLPGSSSGQATTQ